MRHDVVGHPEAKAQSGEDGGEKGQGRPVLPADAEAGPAHPEVGQDVAEEEDEQVDAFPPAMEPAVRGGMVVVFRADEERHIAIVGPIKEQGEEQHGTERLGEGLLAPVGGAQDEQGLKRVGLRDAGQEEVFPYAVPRGGEGQRHFRIGQVHDADARVVGQHDGHHEQRERGEGRAEPAGECFLRSGGRKGQVGDVVAPVLGGEEERAAPESQIEHETQRSHEGDGIPTDVDALGGVFQHIQIAVVAGLPFLRHIPEGLDHGLCPAEVCREEQQRQDAVGEDEVVEELYAVLAPVLAEVMEEAGGVEKVLFHG